MPGLDLIDAPTLRRLLPVGEAVEALRTALRAGLDVTGTPPRSRVPLSAGQLLMMPAEFGQYAGVKIAGVVPGNPARGLPTITGSYLLLEAATLSPLAVLDGEALTLLRTSAVSALAADHLATPDAARLVLFGTGPQSYAHAVALAEVRALRSVAVVGRDPARVQALVTRCRDAGLPAAPGTVESVPGADLIACCTSSPEPLFDGRELAPHATVVAMGSHTPEEREVDSATAARSTVVVEDPATALREAGDIVIPLRQGELDTAELVPLADLVSGHHTVDPSRPRLFKGTGMAWQDLVIATAAHAASTR
ncbi:ornithine cyclodeaminase family protein [Streptomyces iconiensis]|uniref:Ornithine cyclodeaminase family protein n=1 Tax=Streptomyces iconiensis TaxID=1384038 RepID=A0ABT6ZY02_9ACTN|nr:ornithine cyclodeaminase family protein [Streptomyces iconiensis]MDJ1133945.1 ornithine cyclodeaminase family protein [Streptomyces iconiensis]